MGVVETVKDVAELVQKADNIELYRKLVDLQIQVMEMFAMNRDLQEENRTLRERLAFKADLKFVGNRYIRQTDDGEEEYCSGCYDSEGKAIRLQSTGSTSALWCPLCKRYAPGTRPKPSASRSIRSRGF